MVEIIYLKCHKHNVDKYILFQFGQLVRYHHLRNKLSPKYWKTKVSHPFAFFFSSIQLLSISLPLIQKSISLHILLEVYHDFTLVGISLLSQFLSRQKMEATLAAACVRDQRDLKFRMTRCCPVSTPSNVVMQSLRTQTFF